MLAGTLRVVDACRVAAPPVQLRVAVGAGALGLKERFFFFFFLFKIDRDLIRTTVGASPLGLKERINQNNFFEVHTSYVTDTVDCSRHAWVRIMHSLS